MRALKIADRSVVDIMDIHKHDVGKRRPWTGRRRVSCPNWSTDAASYTIRIRRPHFVWGIMSPRDPLSAMKRAGTNDRVLHQPWDVSARSLSNRNTRMRALKIADRPLADIMDIRTLVVGKRRPGTIHVVKPGFALSPTAALFTIADQTDFFEFADQGAPRGATMSL